MAVDYGGGNYKEDIFDKYLCGNTEIEENELSEWTDDY